MACLKIVMLLGFMVLASESCGNVQTSPAAAAQKTVLLTVQGETGADAKKITETAKGDHLTILQDAYSHFDTSSLIMKFLLDGVSCTTAEEIATEMKKDKTIVKEADVKC